LSDWQDEPRWKALAAAVQRQSSEWEKQLIRSAETLTKENQYEPAAALLESAAGLNSVPLNELLAKIRAELILRADRKAEQEAWTRIGSLPDPVERGIALEQFTRRYPDSAHRAAAQQAGDEIVRLLHPRAQQLTEKARAAWAKKDHREFLANVRELESLPFLAAVAPEAETLRKQRTELTHKTDTLLSLARQHSRLATEEEILAARAPLQELLAIDPEHSDAKTLLEAVAQAAGQLTERFLKKAMPYRGKRDRKLQETYKKLLQSVIRLEKDGPRGQQAQMLLDECK
jgi:hypothetical protein